MAIDVKSEKLEELVDPNAEVEQVATGFTFTEGPIWNPTERVPATSATCRATSAARSEDGGVTEVREALQQVQRHDARRRGQPARLRARHELARARAPRDGLASARPRLRTTRARS